jgi:competence protein ComEA
MTTSERPQPLARWASWLQATPAELVGLAMLSLGGLAAAGMLWWGAAQRPSELPPGEPSGAAAHVGDPVGPDGSHAGDEGGGPDADPTGGVRAGSPAPADDGPVVVHVSGAVARPGLVTLPAGARVGEAIEAAGGALADADTARVNLARPLQDGEHVHLPRDGEELPLGWGDAAGTPAGGGDGAGGAGGLTADGRVDLNRATAAELETLPGIGPARAAEIVRHRDEHGPFREPGDLRAVPGIGEKTFQRLAELVTVS